MPMPTVIGCIAQQSAAAPPSAPANVHISTDNSGNYADSFTSVDSVGGNIALTIDGSSTSPLVILTTPGPLPGPYTTEYGAAANANAVIHCYLRADNATSYTMQGAIDSSNFATFGGSTISWSGGAFTAQDATGGSGIGFFAITHGISGRSYTIPDAGDWFKIKVTGSATNATGTTNATNVIITYTFADL